MTTAIQNVAGAASSAISSASKATDALGKDAFMKMLIAQLQNQDPLNPMDGTQFVAQLAQFSSLEQLTNLNQTMGSLPEYLGAFSNAQMVNLIGSEATAEGNSISLNGSSANITYRLPSDIQSGTIKIYDSNGSLVDTVKIGSQKTGLQSTTWNARNQAAGNYTYEISAVDRNSKDVTVDKMISGKITGVSFKNGSSYLTINGQEVAFSNVVAINKSNA
ncbi:MAG: flagellar hook assembly protein FlgD [Deltaproteobacteria bacterium]